MGTCVGRFQRPGLRSWAAELFEQAIVSCAETTSPRAWAFMLLGIHEYFRRLSGDRLVDQLRDDLTGRLVELYERTASDDWPWFEDVAAYDNAKLPHALILSGRWKGPQKGARDRAAEPPLASFPRKLPCGPFPSRRLQRVLQAGPTARRLRSAADRGLLHSFGLYRSISDDARRIMAARGCAWLLPGLWVAMTSV